jgi:2-oxoglutarate ferredoxin oxidoreductase subunit alpha
VPGTPGLEHRIGGLEKADISGVISYDPDNHERMTELRAQKVAGISADIPDLAVSGPERGDLLILGWGSTYGSLRTATERLQRQGHAVAHAHLRHLNPFPVNTGSVLAAYRRVLIPEINTGQLRLLIRGRYLVDAVGLNRVRGKPLAVPEVEQAGRTLLALGRD